MLTGNTDRKRRQGLIPYQSAASTLFRLLTKHSTILSDCQTVSVHCIIIKSERMRKQNWSIWPLTYSVSLAWDITQHSIYLVDAFCTIGDFVHFNTKCHSKKWMLSNVPRCIRGLKFLVLIPWNGLIYLVIKPLKCSTCSRFIRFSSVSKRCFSMSSSRCSLCCWCKYRFAIALSSEWVAIRTSSS